jgi:hypothetical protein
LNNDIADVIMRFRRFDHAMMADVSQIFLQIELKPEDKPYGRFIWFKEGKMIIFEYNQHWFGKTDSPFAAEGDVAVLFEKNQQGQFPLVKILEVTRSGDGNIRRIKVFDGCKLYDRSISNIGLIMESDEPSGPKKRYCALPSRSTA